VVEACTVAKAAPPGIERPIRVLWSREDDIKGGYYRPMHVHRAEIGFDAKGKVLAWDHVIVGQSIDQGTPFEGMMIKDGIDATGVEGMREPYDVPMRLSVHHPSKSTCRCCGGAAWAPPTPPTSWKPWSTKSPVPQSKTRWPTA
jgi:isoquinoline 1-oxidoreductase beta subunit